MQMGHVGPVFPTATMASHRYGPPRLAIPENSDLLSANVSPAIVPIYRAGSD